LQLKDYNSFSLPPQSMFGGLDDGLLSHQARVEALAAVDISKQGPGALSQFKHEVMYGHHPSMGNPHPPPPNSRPQVSSTSSLVSSSVRC
jgi:hypothetical protein